MITARILKITDGDTLQIEIPKLSLRLDFVDAFETKGIERELGLKAKAWMEQQLSVGDEIQIDPKHFDIYGRLIATVFEDGENINGKMLKEGVAEVYSPSNHNNGKLD
ncbi:hypothetical protein BAOM_3143 [Peribacillus asahii]|uniref:TNase-like domain-containing protein n=1 Tax=Peribacillus asahii TaxID=228899 RepID=A0A3Q9RQ31_9BACI|nr:thermonuclease family protein [Peribacillus asahii]AZV43752.1 hypothetical protein BAOM_3143 [Peribacillus asahii]